MTLAQAESSRIDWEGALVERARAGDTRAFERLYREHAGRVYGLCLRMTREPHLAEDCTQETFINAWRALAPARTRPHCCHRVVRRWSQVPVAALQSRLA